MTQVMLIDPDSPLIDKVFGSLKPSETTVCALLPENWFETHTVSSRPSTEITGFPPDEYGLDERIVDHEQHQGPFLWSFIGDWREIRIWQDPAKLTSGTAGPIDVETVKREFPGARIFPGPLKGRFGITPPEDMSVKVGRGFALMSREQGDIALEIAARLILSLQLFTPDWLIRYTPVADTFVNGGLATFEARATAGLDKFVEVKLSVDVRAERTRTGIKVLGLHGERPLAIALRPHGKLLAHANGTFSSRFPPIDELTSRRICERIEALQGTGGEMGVNVIFAEELKRCPRPAPISDEERPLRDEEAKQQAYRNGLKYGIQYLLDHLYLPYEVKDDANGHPMFEIGSIQSLSAECGQNNFIPRLYPHVFAGFGMQIPVHALPIL